MARSAAIPLMIAGVGALFAISGIEGISLGQVVKGELGTTPNPTGKEGGSGSGTELAGFSSNSNEFSGANVTNDTKALEKLAETAGLGSNEKSNTGSTLPPSPGSINSSPPKISIASKVAEALKYKEELEAKVRNGTMSKSLAEAEFGKRYPNYARETHEL